jgi:hypothetical protein
MALIMQGTISHQLVKIFVFIKIDWLSSGVQPCCHLPHVATGDLNVATENCSEMYIWREIHCFSLILVESGDRENLVGHHCFKETVHKNATLLFQSCLNKISTLNSTQETKQIRQFMTILRIQKSGKIWLKKRH